MLVLLSSSDKAQWDGIDMESHGDTDIAVGSIYWAARKGHADDGVAFELARQCYDDLCPCVPPEQAHAEVNRIIEPFREAIAADQLQARVRHFEKAY
ncbi:hypothetical protein GGE65_008373 [Skermanella aerolata]|uniref:hypothetical protein n=1 Tax=Skermanella aerolata TaxID=393310 RepID=UPI003D1F46B3